MYIVSVDSKFASAHSLRGYDGDCARLHGHTWKVTVDILVESTDNAGISLDFKKVSDYLEEITGRLDHQNLNDLDEFREVNPTAENIAKVVFEFMSLRFNFDGAGINSVTVAESEKYRVKYKP